MSFLQEFRQLPRALWVLYAATTMLRIGAFVYPYLTIYLTRNRGFSTADAGWILAAGGCGLVLGNVLGGQLTDRFARKGTLLIALLINVVGYGGLLAAHGSGASYAVWLGVAYTGMGMFSPAAQTVVADLCRPEQRTLAYTGFYFCGNLGIAFGPLIGGVLAAHSFTFVFLGDVATTVVCAALIGFGLPRITRPKMANAAPMVSGLRCLRRDPRTAMVCLSSFFLTAPLMGLEYAVPLLVDRVFDAPLYWVGIVYTANALTILSSSFVIERLIRGRPELPFLVAAAALWTLGLVWLYAGWSVPALVASTVVWTLGEILASVLVPSYVAARAAPEAKGRFLALGDLGRSIATVLSPITLGYLWLSGGASLAVATILCVPLIGIVVFGVLWITARRAPQLAPTEPAR